VSSQCSHVCRLRFLLPYATCKIFDIEYTVNVHAHNQTRRVLIPNCNHSFNATLFVLRHASKPSSLNTNESGRCKPTAQSTSSTPTRPHFYKRPQAQCHLCSATLYDHGCFHLAENGLDCGCRAPQQSTMSRYACCSVAQTPSASTPSAHCTNCNKHTQNKSQA
jgi:hypothetical protein